MQSLEKTRVDLTGLMRVLGEALYSTPYVAIRELVQNAHDSCSRRLLEDGRSAPPRITVLVTPGFLTIADNGAGLTREEIHAYLATVGAGYTRILREQSKSDALIGYFGLGFLSAFTISERVEVWTCSYREPQLAHRFVSRSGETYSVDIAEARDVGTEVRLTLRPEFSELCDAEVVSSCLQRYCCLLEHPIAFADTEPVNASKPPWKLGDEVSSVRQRTLSLEFAQRFESSFAPMATIPVATADGAVQGLLWIQDGSSYASSDNRNVSVYVRGMLISDDERDLLPRWAGFVGAVLESASLNPTASRESLQKNAAYERAAQVVHQCLLDGLAAIAANDRVTWRRILARHNEALLGAALTDDGLYKLVADDLTVPTTEGDFTLNALVHRCKGKIYVSQSTRADVESLLFRALRMPVVLGTRYAALPFCQRYVRQHSGQLVMLGTHSGDQWLFAQADLPEQQIAQLADWFAAPDREVCVRTFEPAYLPFVLITDRDVELKRRLESDEADRRISQGVLGLARRFTQQIDKSTLIRMYLNAGNPAVQALLTASARQRSVAMELLQPLLLITADAGVGVDSEAALRRFGDALLRLLGKDA